MHTFLDLNFILLALGKSLKVPVYLLVSDVGRGMGTGTKSYSEID